MGRKVHPTGFRLKVIRDWDARWFAEGDEYADLLHEDLAIRKIIRSIGKHAAISRVEIERKPNDVKVTLWTAKPGVVIGRKGATVKELRTGLENLTGGRVRVEVEEITKPDLDAKLVAENIASQIERRISHARAMKRAVGQAMRQGAKGIKVMCAGRLHGSEMARTAWQMEGQVPRNTLRADIDYGFTEASTTFGRIGVKVWVYKGEVLGESRDVYVS
ncbi:MAG: 30S ribosomal protein S3 [Chloroflexota bacterium]